MKNKAIILLAISSALCAFGLSAASPASAAFGLKKWEAGTCTDPNCTYASANSAFFTQAAGHPPAGITDFELNTGGLLGAPEGSPLSQVRVDLPPGLNVNPQAAPQCPKATFEANAASCASLPGGSAAVGTSYVTAISGAAPVQLPFTVYNLVPDNGSPALFGFHVKFPELLPIVNADIFLVADIEWAGDYHEGFTISNIPTTAPLIRNRLVFGGTIGNSFITVPSPCNGPTTTSIRVTSSTGETSALSTTPAGPGKPVPIVGCQKVPFKPGVSATPGTAAVDSPAPLSATVTVPQSTPQNPMAINSSTVRNASVTLPAGTGLNPAAAETLTACTDAQFGKGKRTPVACPAKSKIGTVSIQTPVLPANSLPGTVFLGQQLSRNPESGNQYRIFIDAESPRYGLSVRLLGNVIANAKTGQLTAVIKDAPQVTFSSFTLQFNGGEQAPLTSPPTCGPNLIAASLAPWSGQALAAPTGSFSLSTLPGGGACPKTLAARPFAPGFTAAPKTDQAKTYTPFTVNITRAPGQQELKAVNVTLPPGATAKLAGVPYCAPSDFNTAVGKSAEQESKSPSCPKGTLVGVATIRAGSGNKPLQIGGQVYLAGPYKGAPLSLVVITPAKAGPFDLGNVVVRVALNLDPGTAQINAVSDPIPDVFGGAKLDIRSIFVNVNRDNFTLTGTNCNKSATAGAILGGGADPSNPAAFSSVPVSSPFQGKGCDGLDFSPQLKLQLSGGIKRNKNPRLHAELTTRPGDANIARASVALPKAIFLDQASLAKVCTRPQFAANNCPDKSIYGRAVAYTPLLDKPLEGPVFLRSSNNTLPDLVAHLQGQVDIDLVGRIDSFKGGIRTTFDRVPDVPVTKFELTLNGGKGGGLLVNSTNICIKKVKKKHRKPKKVKKRIKAIVQLEGQNGKTANARPIVKASCKKKKKRKHGTKKHGAKKHAGKNNAGKKGGKKNQK